MVDAYSETIWCCGKCGAIYDTQEEAEDCCMVEEVEPEEEK